MNKKNKSLLKAILPWVLVLVIIGSIIPVLTNRNAGSETLTYSEFTKALEDEKIKEVTVKPQSYVVDVTGKYTKKVDGKNRTVSFSTLVPATDEEVDSLMQVIKDQGVKAKVADASDDNMVINIIMNLIPYIILIGGMVFLFKYMNAAGGGNAKAFEFGNSRAKLEKNEKTHFSDVAGADEEKEEVKETEVPVKTGIIYGTKSTPDFTSVQSMPQTTKEVKVIYRHIPVAYGWKCSYCDGINNDGEKRCQICGMER